MSGDLKCNACGRHLNTRGCRGETLQGERVRVHLLVPTRQGLAGNLNHAERCDPLDSDNCPGGGLDACWCHEVEERAAVADLNDFLLARIAEDSDRIGHLAAWPSATGGDSVPRLSQWLADCKAKRRIIALAQADHGGDAFNRAAWEQVLLEMAAPYAGHPDYREEWRP